MYSIAVIELGLSPEYFLDKMQLYEIPTIVRNANLKNKDSWEQARFISFITAQVNSTKKMKPTDLMLFSWDNEVVDTSKSISNEDRERLKNKSKQYENKI